MEVALLCAVALTLSLRFSTAWKEYGVCGWANPQSCAECIQESESCGWCSDESFLSPMESTSTRCDDLKSLLERNCPLDKIVNPRGTLTIEKNLQLTDHRQNFPEEQIIQIQPQKLRLSLRSGEPQTFSVKFKRAVDFPIDLYFLMDLSSSMKDDLENTKNLGTDLMKEMQQISSDFRIGFGSIVKTTRAQPDDSCRRLHYCPGLFRFKNILKLTDKAEEFTRLVSQQQISDSLDSPEGGFSSIQQVALCEEQIGWRRASTRLLVLSTDAGFHSAPTMTTVPRGGQCQLENHTYTNEGQSSRSFFSVFDLARTLSDHNIQTIFTVTENVLPLYQKLQNRLPKSAVGALTSNSSNILELIMDAFNSLSSEMILENSRLPRGVSISYKSLCKNGVEGTGEDGRRCSNISIGDEVSFKISITAQKCPEHGQAEMVKIKPLGFNEEVEVVLNFICECQCSAQGVPQSDRCNRSGTWECGACRCPKGRAGQQCECDPSLPSDVEVCIKDKGSFDICSNNGDCVCGRCECKKRENPKERYYGQFCECDNFNCPRSNNKLCGGHGQCLCRVCLCDANYTGIACDCTRDVTPCVASSGQICNGKGVCECGQCRCTNPKYQGPTCETCPTCPGVCTLTKACVQCRAFGTGEKAESCDADCGDLIVTKLTDRGHLPQPNDFPFFHCKERDHNDCWFYYAINPHSKEVHVVQSLDCLKVSLWGSVGPRVEQGIKNSHGFWLGPARFGIALVLIMHLFL